LNAPIPVVLLCMPAAVPIVCEAPMYQLEDAQNA
jgi:hypothetical protein